MASWKRARTADREAAVELINTAFVDGQLDAVQRDDKVSRALVARTIGEVNQTTADLQTPGKPVPPMPGGLTGWWHTRSRAVRVGLAAALLLPLGGGAVAVLGHPDDQTDTQSAATQAERDPIEVNAATVRDLLADYETEFGTTQTYGVIVMRDWTRVFVPTTEGQARYEIWTWEQDGEFEQSGAKGAGELLTFDLAQIDLDALASTLELATSDLGVEDPTRTEIDISHSSPDESPTITVNVVNKYEESGYLITDPVGKVITKEPYVTP